MNTKIIKAVLIDLSGTLHTEDTVMTGAIVALQKLRSAQVKIKFVTNTTKECKRILHERLTRIGFSIDPNEIFSSLSAASQLIKKRNLKPYMLIADEAKEDFPDSICENPDAVLVGLAPKYFNIEHLTRAFRLLLNGAPLIAIHKGRYYKEGDGLSLGPGPFVTALEYAADCKAEVVGKPTSAFFHMALEDLQCSSEEAVMIGDDVTDDVGGAMSVGMLGVLVQTGKYQCGDETKIDPRPSLVVKNFATAVDYLIQNWIAL